jgi:hypothetical protein
VAEDARATLGQLAAVVEAHFGRRLIGLYLFGSLAAGAFHQGRSDLDLFAVLDSEVGDDEVDALRAVHADFEGARPEWRDRVEVLYISHAVLATFAAQPTGRVTRISPGEPLHHRELGGDMGWILDWCGVVTVGETLFGPPPLELGPAVTAPAFEEAVRSQLGEWTELVRQREVAYVPAHQGYIVASVCRALYTLATGEQTSKESAVAWFAGQHPEWATFVRDAYRAYRADLDAPHQKLIRFVDEAVADASTIAGDRRAEYGVESARGGGDSR